MPEFGILDSDGSYEKQGYIDQDDMRKCPHYIMAFEHYRIDGSCRCDDPSHLDMATWGYVWNYKTLRWDSPPDDEE